MNLGEEFIYLLRGVFLYRVMANVVKDILDSCSELTSEDVKIVPQNLSDTNVHVTGESAVQCLDNSKEPDNRGEQIQIDKIITESTKQCLQEILKKYDLLLKEEQNKTIIYLPPI